MVRAMLLSLAWSALILSTGASSQDSAGETEPEAPEMLSYGPDPMQTLDFWPSAAVDPELVVFVHGGGWSGGDKRMMQGSDKLRHWQGEVYAVASLNYRLVPEATVEQQAEDVAAAIALLKTQADVWGFDPERIALVGHSAGAHLVALVGTDERYLRSAGLSFDDISGVVLLDGAAYDVAMQLEEGPRIMRRTYRRAFGDVPERHARLSPTTQAGAPNAPAFLILHLQREDGVRQSEKLAAALRRAGTPVEVRGFAGTGLRGHAEINRRMGEEGYPPTAALDTFLARIFDHDATAGPSAGAR